MYIYTHIHTYIHTYIKVTFNYIKLQYITCIHACMHACMHAYIHNGSNLISGEGHVVSTTSTIVPKP